MHDDDATEQSEPNRYVKRRKILLATGTFGVSTFLAGCTGQGGPGANDTATQSPNGGSMPTQTPTAADSMATETDAETDTPTDTGTDTPSGGDASVRVAHLSPNAPEVDIYVDGSVALEAVAFGTVSDYLNLASGSHEIEITSAGDAENSVFQGDVNIESGTDYTVAAVGEVGADGDQPFEPLVLMDNNQPPNDQTARLRVVHASPDAPDVDITSDGSVLFDGLAYGEASYAEVPAGDYTVEIRGDTTSNDGDVVASTDITLEGGQVYTAFAAGYLSPEDEPESTPFEVILVQDTDGM